MMKLRINPIVADDLKKIKEYIAEDNEEMAVKTIQEIYTRIENIQQFPRMEADLSKRVGFRTDYKYIKTLRGYLNRKKVRLFLKNIDTYIRLW